jgi:hypothetical protein
MRSSDQNIPSETGYTKANNGRFDTSWGVSLTGVQIYNGISGDGIDPFGPAPYRGRTVASYKPYFVDMCLGHPAPTGVYHYHNQSPCIINKTYFDKPEVDSKDKQFK